MRLKLSFLLVFIITYSWSQSGSTKTFTGNGTFLVPAGVTSITVQAWGGGGSGGGASGAPLLLGRGAAGGGGGAYASNSISVTPGTTLNVVVASQTAGTTGAGTAGGSSTITGFESSILAAGGSGGGANNAGGSPIGGIGGTVAASAGTTKFAGTNGGNGNSWNLLGLLLSSGAGGAGANFGGAGGTAVSGLIFSNAPGNAGSPPGGGGSGGINSALGAAQIGGAGAAGRIIISYDCPNFSLTSAAATNVCGATSTTSTVTLTGSAASLPIGNYVVTYNRSSPSATALTANLTVTTAGTGTFTAVGLTVAGSSTITITKLTSDSCSSTITTNNTATITVSPASVGGTVNGGTTVCSGSPSGVLTLSGNIGTVVKWQSSVSPFSTWTDIVNTNATYTSGVLTETTQFRAVVQSGVCTAVNSAATTVTVSPLPTIIPAANAARICVDGNENTTTLDVIQTTGSPVTYSIVWASSPANSFVPVTDAALTAGPIAISVPAGTTADIYTGILTVKNANGCESQFAQQFYVRVDNYPSITTTGTIDAVTTSTSSQNASLPYSASTANPTAYSIDWDAAANAVSLADQPSTSFSFNTGGGTINTIDIPANVPAGIYSGIIRISNVLCFKDYPISITVNARPTIALATSAENVCRDIFSEEDDHSLLAYTGTTGNPTTYSIVWDASPENTFVAVTNAALPASPITITVPSGTEKGIYTGTLTVKNANGTVSSPGSVFSVNVDYVPAIVTSGIINEVETSTSSQNASLPFDGTIGSPISYSIDWDAAANAALLTDQPSSPFTWSSFGGNIDTILIPANVPAGTYSGIITSVNETCSSSKPVSITINPTEELPTIGLAFKTDDICLDDSNNEQYTPLSFKDTTGDPVSYSIVWDSSPANSFVPVTNAALPASPISIAVPGNTDAGTYTGTLTVKDANGVNSLGKTFTVNVGIAPYINLISSLESVYASTNLQYTILSYYGSEGNATSYYIDWDEAANTALLQDQAITPVALNPNAGNITTIEVSANAQPGTYSGTFYLGDGTCTGSYPVTITINPAALPTIALAVKTDDVCLDGSNNLQYTTLSFKDTTGDPVSYSIVWDSSPSNNLVAVTNAPLPASPISIAVPGDTNPGIYTGTLTVKDVNGVSSLDKTFTVNVGKTPVMTANGVIEAVSTSTNIQYTTLEYSQMTGYPVSYSIDWDETANNALLEDQPNTLYEFLGIGDLIETIEISANAQPGTYSGIMYFTDGSCTGSHPVSVVINEAQSAKATLPKDSAITGLGKNAISVGIDNKVITVEAPNQIIKEVFVFDVSGALLYKKNKVSDSKLVITDLRSSNQVLVVRVVMNNNQSEVKKVIY